MNNPAQIFLLDANVFIEAYRRYYSFDICPGFWECLMHHHHESVIFSIDRIKDEVKTGDDLGKWVKDSAQKSLFFSTEEPEVSRQYSAIMQWVQASSQFRGEAKAEFAQIADGWLVAFAKARSWTVVTHEVYDPSIKKKVPIPNICKEFNVACVDTFAMLRAVHGRFAWDRG